MEAKDFLDIKAIQVIGSKLDFGYTMDKWKFIKKEENGDMALITWVEVWKNGEKVAYLPLSSCMIFFKV
jgi:hypothetical protein